MSRQRDITRLRWPSPTQAPKAVGPGKYLFPSLAIVSIVLLVIAAFWMHKAVERSLHHIVAANLETILEIDVAALRFWLENEQADIESWAEEARVRALTQELIVLASQTRGSAAALHEAPQQQQLRSVLEPLIDTDDYLGFTITDRAGLVLAAHETGLIGKHLSPEGLALAARAFERSSLWVAPFWQGTHIAAIERKEDHPIMGITATIRDDSSEPIAQLFLMVPPEKDFTRILSIARMGDSGDTYAFDANGEMLSDTRHLDELKAAGILPDVPTVRAIRRVQLRDPGGNLLAAYRTDTPVAARPLTRLIAAALADDTSPHVFTDAYRDYRGVAVVGAARWLPELDFGVATEVDAKEAFRALLPIDIALAILAILLGIALSGILVFSFVVRRLGRRIEEVKQLGQYSLEEKIGEGGMGKVYLARHALLRRPTAVKLIGAEKADEETLARFEREVQLTSQLTHPNTIEIYDYGHTSEGIFYYVMEYLPGIDLARLIEQEGAIPAVRAAHIVRQICGSLSEAHGKGLIHRDIKPLNVILTERGGQLDFVKVLDFGLVKDVSSATDHTVADAIPGTPPYIAPERLRDPLNIDTRSDLYSLGAIAFNLLTGRPVFDGKSSMEIAYQVVQNPAPRASEFASITPELDQLVSDCLERNPDDRPQTAQAIIDRLDAVMGNEQWSQADARDWWDQHPELLLHRAAE
ncbi:protein kinase domain-containing protein [Thiogranum longum]